MINYPDTLIKIIALRRERYHKELPLLCRKEDKDYVLVEEGEIFLAESENFLWGRFDIFTLNKEYVGRAYNDGYNFITLENLREKQIKSILE